MEIINKNIKKEKENENENVIINIKNKKEETLNVEKEILAQTPEIKTPVASNYYSPEIMQRANSGKTEYFSVMSEPIVLKTRQTPEFFLETSYEEISSSDSFDSSSDEETNNYQLDVEYEQMRDFLHNKDFNRMRELDKKIVQKEITKRKAENKRRLERLKKLEEKVMTDVRRVSYGNSNVNNTLHLNLPNMGGESIKSKLYLANSEKEGGFFIFTQEEVEAMFDQQKFCDFYFYTKKY